MNYLLSHKNNSILKFLTFICFLITILLVLKNARANTVTGNLNNLVVGVAGTPPFVIDTTSKEGISIELWQALAMQLGWTYQFKYFDDVPGALKALESGKVDAVAGPVSITAERAKHVRFTQPYYQSSLSILSRTDSPSIWERIRPFFSTKFFVAVLIFILILGGVGTVLWMAEREHNPNQFPPEPAKGIANGMWCAIVTMSTTGYGDIAPVTFWGRVAAGSWMVISIVFATTMVAGIASTLTLTGMNTSVIATANELSGKKVAVVSESPAESFVKQYGAKNIAIESLEEGYKMLKSKQVDAVVYDRPQLLYFLKKHHDNSVAVSASEYVRQGYGFAMPLNTTYIHQMNVTLLQLQESGRVERIVHSWLGDKD